MHFLALNSEDRRLRFGTALSDEALTHYVQHVDFHRDVLFGAYDDGMILVGVGQLAFIRRDAVPSISTVTSKDRLAEGGLSVIEREREKSIGTNIFRRMALRCRTEDIDAMILRCLADNQAMMHIAHKIGMVIRFDGVDSDACLKLPPQEDGVITEKHSPGFADTMKQTRTFRRSRHR